MVEDTRSLRPMMFYCGKGNVESTTGTDGYIFRSVCERFKGKKRSTC